MQLYIDDKLVSTEADGPALDKALARLRYLGAVQLEARRARDSRLTLTYHRGDLFIEVEVPGRTEGMSLADDWEEAHAALRAYGEGKAIKLHPLPPGRSWQLISGTPYDEHCPLCRMFS